MSGLEVRELECFLALAEELHFGRAGERLYVSQSRVSQLLAALEQRIGARLVERTSRRVRLTPLGERFHAELRPAYAELADVVGRARESARGVAGRIRIGFQGTADARLMEAITTFQKRHPGCVTEIVEVPFADPFGAVRQGDVDAAIVSSVFMRRLRLSGHLPQTSHAQIPTNPRRRPLYASGSRSNRATSGCRLPWRPRARRKGSGRVRDSPG